MAMKNRFDLLREKPAVVAAASKKGGKGKQLLASQQHPAKLPSKPLPRSQAVREKRSEGGHGGGGHGCGRGRGRGGYQWASANNERSFSNTGVPGGQVAHEDGDAGIASERWRDYGGGAFHGGHRVQEKEMTLEEYEKVLEEERKALQALKTQERKESDEDKKKKASKKDEKAKKSVRINESLRPAAGESCYNRGGHGRGCGCGSRGSGNRVPVPSIEDPNHFPTLCAKNEIKLDGSGRGNWGTTGDDLAWRSGKNYRNQIEEHIVKFQINHCTQFARFKFIDGVHSGKIDDHDLSFIPMDSLQIANKQIKLLDAMSSPAFIKVKYPSPIVFDKGESSIVAESECSKAVVAEKVFLVTQKADCSLQSYITAQQNNSSPVTHNRICILRDIIDALDESMSLGYIVCLESSTIFMVNDSAKLTRFLLHPEEGDFWKNQFRRLKSLANFILGPSDTRDVVANDFVHKIDQKIKHFRRTHLTWLLAHPLLHEDDYDLDLIMRVCTMMGLPIHHEVANRPTGDHRQRVENYINNHGQGGKQACRDISTIIHNAKLPSAVNFVFQNACNMFLKHSQSVNKLQEYMIWLNVITHANDTGELEQLSEESDNVDLTRSQLLQAFRQIDPTFAIQLHDLLDFPKMGILRMKRNQLEICCQFMEAALKENNVGKVEFLSSCRVIASCVGSIDHSIFKDLSDKLFQRIIVLEKIDGRSVLCIVQNKEKRSFDALWWLQSAVKFANLFVRDFCINGHDPCTAVSVAFLSAFRNSLCEREIESIKLLLSEGEFCVEEIFQFFSSKEKDDWCRRFCLLARTLVSKIQHIMTTDRSSDYTSHSSESDLHDSIWGYDCRSYSQVLTNFQAPSQTSLRSNESDLPQKVLESLFNISKSSEHEPSTMNWRNVVQKTQALGPGPDFCPSSDTVPQQDIYARGDEYHLFRESAKQHWNSMRSYFRKAAAAFSKGQWEYAAYLSEHGKGQTNLARKADEKAWQDIFLARNKGVENVPTIDLHGQHVKEALKIVKIHLIFGAYVRPIQILRVITGCGSHGVGKSIIKQSVIKLLEKEGVEWREENQGTLLIKLDGYREYSFLDSDSDPE